MKLLLQVKFFFNVPALVELNQKVDLYNEFGETPGELDKKF